MSDMDERRWEWASRGLLALVAVLVLATVSDYGSSWDEQVRRDAGDKKLNYYQLLLAGDFEKAVEVGSAPDNYPGFYDLNLAVLRKISPFSEVVTGHLFSALFGMLAIAGTIRLGRMLGGPQIGFYSGLALVFVPRFYGHWFINPKDIPFACAYVWGIVYALDWLRRESATDWKTVFRFGMVLGAAMAMRVGGAILLCYLGLFLLLQWYSKARTSNDSLIGEFGVLVKSQGLRIIVALGIGTAIMFLYWPASQFRPFGQASATLNTVVNYSWDLPVFFEGNFVRAKELPFYYILKMILITTPLLTLGLLATGLIVIAREQAQQAKNSVWSFERWTALNLVIFSLVFPLVFVIARNSTLYNGVRHLLFVIPMIAVLSAWGWKWVLDRIHQHDSKWDKILPIAGGALLALVGMNMIRLHPYQYIYYNEIVGGLSGASSRFETDYWGTVYKELGDRFCEYEKEKGLAEKRSSYAINMEHPTWLLKPHLNCDPSLQIELFRSNGLSDDFFVASTQWAADRYYYGQPIIAVERMGVLLGLVKDRRGLSPNERALGYEPVNATESQ